MRRTGKPKTEVPHTRNDNMTTMDKQAKCAAQIQVPSYLSGLYGQGYTLKEASEVLGCTHGHLARVLKGERVPSAGLLGRLKSLPKKQLVLRRRVSAYEGGVA